MAQGRDCEEDRAAIAIGGPKDGTAVPQGQHERSVPTLQDRSLVFGPETAVPALPHSHRSRGPAPSPSWLHAPLLAWYARRRRDLPWRQGADPYRVLVSEFMLQQTQAERVTPRFSAFLQQFPDFAALAAATTADVLRAWSGLGYNQRALRLQQIARTVTAQFGGILPSDSADLRRLPGIGPYTAAAVACFAFGAQIATVDTNIRRVLQRLVGADGPDSQLTERQVWELAGAALPEGRAADWNQALMDLGATVCTARAPACPRCPVADLCRFRQDGRTSDIPPAPVRRTKPKPPQPFVGSSRYYRGRVLRVLSGLDPGAGLALPVLGRQIKEDYAGYDATWLESVLTRLERDGLVALEHEEGEITARLPES
jgi:A/G-specific adenine glycosylase